jgi:putative ATP-dependent endonuclease of OLD family
MRIEKVYVENFRCIKEAEILFDDATSFVGRNGVGKSTILYALDSFYTPSTQYSKLDYYGHNSELEIKIRVTYGSLREDELKEFSEYIKDNKLVVSKKINSGGARYYGASAQIPIFADARKVPFQARRTLLKETFENGELPGLAAIPNNAAALDVLMAEYESAHPDMQAPIERETQFFGSKNVGGGKLDNFTKFVLVPAVRDASNEMEKRGAIMQLLDLIVTRSIANREDFQKFKTDFEAKAKELYGKDNLPELTKLGESVSERLRRYSPGADLSIDFEELKPPSIPLPDATVSVSEDNFSVPVRYTGHGLQRAVVLSLLEQLSLTPVPQVNPANTDTNTEKCQFHRSNSRSDIGYRRAGVVSSSSSQSLSCENTERACYKSRRCSSSIHSSSLCNSLPLFFRSAALQRNSHLQKNTCRPSNRPSTHGIYAIQQKAGGRRTSKNLGTSCRRIYRAGLSYPVRHPC